MGLADAKIRCIYCDNILDENTKPEHILNNALGGRKATQCAICTDHNEIFGSSIDREVAEQASALRNLHQMTSGTGKAPPGLRNVESSKGPVNIRGDGTIAQYGKPYEIIRSPEGVVVSLKFNVRDISHLKQVLPQAAAEANIPEEQLLAQVADVRSVSVPNTDQIKLELKLGGPALRSIVKSLLSLWSTVKGTNEVRGDAFADARVFVLNGSENFLTTRMRMDSRYLPDVDQIKAAYGPLFNLLYLRSDENGRLVGHFTLYNLLGWQFQLTSSGATPNTVACLVSNPLDPTAWSDDSADLPDMPMNWLDAPDYSDNFVRANERMNAMMAEYLQSSRKRETGRIIGEVFEKHVGKPTEPPQEMIHIATPEMIQELAHRITLFAVGQPHEEMWTTEQIAALKEQSKS